MVDVFVERQYHPAITPADVFAIASKAGGCFGLYKVNWVESMLAGDGSQMLCHFQVPDLESIRTAFRQSDGHVPPLWPGTLHTSSKTPVGTTTGLNDILVARRFESPVTLDEIQALEDAGAWCLETREVHFVRTFFSLSQTRMICLYRAPDAEAVRAAQRQAGVPFEAVWTYRHLTPESMPGN